MQHGEPVSTGPFEDEETKALYESLPDIRAMVPALLLGTTSEQKEADGEPGHAADDEPQLVPGEEAAASSVAPAHVSNEGRPCPNHAGKHSYICNACKRHICCAVSGLPVFTEAVAQKWILLQRSPVRR